MDFWIEPFFDNNLYWLKDSKARTVKLSGPQLYNENFLKCFFDNLISLATMGISGVAFNPNSPFPPLKIPGQQLHKYLREHD